MIVKKTHFRNKKCRRNHRKSPTWSVESHDKWGSYHCRALSGLHEKISPQVCGTIAFPNATKELISEFTKKYSRSIRYENKKTKGISKSALFGVFEITNKFLVHMHFIARDFDLDHLLRFIKKFNKKNNTLFECPYFMPIEDVDSISAYPFKFGFQRKILFGAKSLNRYVFQTGSYFLGMKKALEREGFEEFIHQKIMRNFDQNILSTAEDYLEKYTSQEANQQFVSAEDCSNNYFDSLLFAVLCWILIMMWMMSSQNTGSNGIIIEPVYPAPIPYPP